MPDPKKRHSIHPEATLDLRLAARWYELRRRGLGVEFVLAVDDAIATIVAAPRTKDRPAAPAGISTQRPARLGNLALPL